MLFTFSLFVFTFQTFYISTRILGNQRKHQGGQCFFGCQEKSFRGVDRIHHRFHFVITILTFYLAQDISIFHFPLFTFSLFHFEQILAVNETQKCKNRKVHDVATMRLAVVHCGYHRFSRVFSVHE